MGRDKALLPASHVAPLSFIERLASLLSELCPEVLLVARDQASVEEYLALPSMQFCRGVSDQLPGQGPLMGLYSGLQACSFSHALVLAVDLPLVTPALLSWLGSFPYTEEALIPLVDDFPQVLLARYARSQLSAIASCLESGRRDPRALLKMIPVHFLEETLVRTVDPALRSFLNTNTPEDLQQAYSLN